MVPLQSRGRGRGRNTEADPTANPNAPRRKTTRGVSGKGTQETQTQDRIKTFGGPRPCLSFGGFWGPFGQDLFAGAYGGPSRGP